MNATRWRRVLGAATLTLAMVSLSACVSDSEGSSDPVGASEIDPDAKVNVAWAGPPTNLDPHRQVSPAEIAFTSMMYDRLTRMSGDGNRVIPMLAESWEFSPDGKQLTMKLRSDVVFQDGTKFDSSVVKANIERGKTVDGTTVAADLAPISSVETPDATTVVFNLSSGGAALPITFATNVGMMISPKAMNDGRDLKLEPGDAGSGPYRLVDFKPNEQTSFVRFEDYWDKETPRAKEVTITGGVTSAAGLNGLRAGQYDIVQITIGADTQPAIDGAATGGYEVFIKEKVLGSHTLMMNSNTAPLNNLKFRQAISYAIDRDAIGNQLYLGHCVPSVQPYSQGNLAYNPELDAKHQYNLEKAKQLLAESGVTDTTFEIEFGPAHQTTAEAVQAQLQEAGINAQLKPVPQSEVSPRFNSGQSAATLTGIVPGANYSTYLSRYVLSGATISRGGDPALVERVKQLADEALDPTLSEQDRGERYQEIESIILDQAWSVQVCSAKHVWPHNPKLVGVDDEMPGLWAGLPEFDKLAMRK